MAARHGGDAVRARFVAPQVAYRERDDVFAGTPATCMLAMAASRNMQQARYIGLFDTTAAFVHSPTGELSVLIPTAVTVIVFSLKHRWKDWARSKQPFACDTLGGTQTLLHVDCRSRSG